MFSTPLVTEKQTEFSADLQLTGHSYCYDTTYLLHPCTMYGKSPETSTR